MGRDSSRVRKAAVLTRSRVLVVWDQGSEPRCRWQEALHEAEFELRTPEGAAEISMDGSAIDLAVLDADLDEAVLEAWLKVLRENPRHCRVLLLTSNFTGQNVVRLAARCDLVLPKPLDGEAFAAAADWLLRRDEPVVRFSDRYKLSQRETALVRASLAGMNNDEAAAALGCTRATVSTYWNRIFRKTGVSGQRDVIILLFRPESWPRVDTPDVDRQGHIA